MRAAAKQPNATMPATPPNTAATTERAARPPRRGPDRLDAAGHRQRDEHDPEDAPRPTASAGICDGVADRDA